MQVDLFLPQATHTHDPLTSHMAEESHKEKRVYNIGLVLEVVYSFPNHTREWYSNKLGMDKIEVSRRLTDLKINRKVFISGRDGRFSTWRAL